jgi:hypothetical protein
MSCLLEHRSAFSDDIPGSGHANTDTEGGAQRHARSGYRDGHSTDADCGATNGRARVFSNHRT